MNESTSNYTNRVVLMSSLSAVNQYGYITWCVNCVVAHWTRVLGLMGSNAGQVKTFFIFHATAMLLFYIIQRITTPKFCIFQKSITIRHCMALLQVALVSIPQVCSSTILVLLIAGN
jgi:hypothetical protein